jgi:hypothetical protein
MTLCDAFFLLSLYTRARMELKCKTASPSVIRHPVWLNHANRKTSEPYTPRQRLGLSARARAAVVHPHPWLPFSVSPETWGTTTGETQSQDTLGLAAKYTFALIHGVASRG